MIPHTTWTLPRAHTMGPAAFERAPSWPQSLGSSPAPAQPVAASMGWHRPVNRTYCYQHPNTTWTPLIPARAAEAPEGHLLAVKPVSRGPIALSLADSQAMEPMGLESSKLPSGAPHRVLESSWGQGLPPPACSEVSSPGECSFPKKWRAHS